MAWMLEPAEVRVLGVLIEKQRSTPDYYPLTVNALVTGCNQKTNRDPVVEYGEDDVIRALDGLKKHRLVGIAHEASSRATKYRHTLAETLALPPAALAVLAVLLLRGPQTVGEIRGRTGRLYPFESLEEVERTLKALAAREAALAVELPVLAGQKEARHAHLLAGEPDIETLALASPASSASGSDHLAALEAEVAALTERLEALEAAFEAFRQEFE